jgi:hypothetical protein
MLAERSTGRTLAPERSLLTSASAAPLVTMQKRPKKAVSAGEKQIQYS